MASNKRNSNSAFRPLVWGALFAALGAGLWWISAQTARFSVRKWDVTMETAVKHSLVSAGVSDADVLSSIHEIRRDDKGEWVVHQITCAMKDSSKLPEMVKQLENTGAQVEQRTVDGNPMLIVKRGSRVYQEIKVQVH